MQSDSEGFIEDDHHEQLTIQSPDTIKIIVDVEEDVRREVSQQIKMLESKINVQDEMIKEKEQILSKLQTEEEHENSKAQKDENDNINLLGKSTK